MGDAPPGAQHDRTTRPPSNNVTATLVTDAAGTSPQPSATWLAPQIECDRKAFNRELAALTTLLPDQICQALRGINPAQLLELYVALGRRPELRMLDDDGLSNKRQWVFPDRPNVVCTQADLDLFQPLFASKTSTLGSKMPRKRFGINGTLHRISITTKPREDRPGHPKVIAVTIRIGRSVRGVVLRMLPDILS